MRSHRSGRKNRMEKEAVGRVGGVEEKPVAQRQDMVIGTLALLFCFSKLVFKVSRAADPKGTMSCRTQGESVRPYVLLQLTELPFIEAS